MHDDDVRTAQNMHNMVYHLGDLIIRWNGCEGSLRYLLALVSGGGIRFDILAAHFNPDALMNAFRTFAAETLDSPFKDHVLHAATYFDRLREYRNYYVHGIYLVSADREGRAVGLANSLSARGRLVLHPKQIGIGDLLDLMAKMAMFEEYIRHLNHFYQWSKDSNWQTFDEYKLIPTEKPKLPDKLDKPKLYPLEQEAILREQRRRDADTKPR